MGQYWAVLGQFWGHYWAARWQYWVAVLGQYWGQYWGITRAVLWQYWGITGAMRGHCWGSPGGLLGGNTGGHYCWALLRGTTEGMIGALMVCTTVAVLWGSIGAARCTSGGCSGAVLGLCWASYGPALGLSSAGAGPVLWQCGAAQWGQSPAVVLGIPVRIDH